MLNSPHTVPKRQIDNWAFLRIVRLKVMRELLRNRVVALLRKHNLLLSRIDELTCLADRFGSDKGNLHDAHGYTRIYQRLFGPLRERPITLLEMGLLRPDVDDRRKINATEGFSNFAKARRAPSLEMWRAFFPNAEIFGFDIDDFSQVRQEGYTILR